MENKTILKVLVGSQAHGLATPESDFDYRAVFVVPTSEILSLGKQPKNTNWIEGAEDNTAWELGHFLNMAIHCNPTILETFLAPRVDPRGETAEQVADPQAHLWGKELRALFPHVWNTHGVMNAFIGYGLNQRKKFLEEKDKRPNKFAAAYLRSLANAHELLLTGTFTVNIASTAIGDTVRRFKEGNYSYGEVIDTCRTWEALVRDVAKGTPPKKTNVEPINEFLLKVRKANW